MIFVTRDMTEKQNTEDVSICTCVDGATDGAFKEIRCITWLDL